MVEHHGIAYHEKELGQLFCNDSSKQIVKMLLDECVEAGVRIDTGVETGSRIGLDRLHAAGKTATAFTHLRVQLRSGRLIPALHIRQRRIVNGTQTRR